MKTSKYNFFFHDANGNHYAFNGLSGGLLQLSENDSHKMQGILVHLGDGMAEDRNGALWQALQEGSFVLDDETNELEVLKARNRLVRFSGNRLFLTVVTTQLCNLRCTYCFQEHENRSMGPEVRELLLRLVATSVKSCKEVHVHWYGGEPLLCFPMIRELSQRLQEVCGASGCRYSASMSTNGFLLEKQIAVELAQLGLERIQVTLDGPRDVHDRRRPLLGGQGTFQTILENVIAAAEDIPVTVRVNLDRDNVSRAGELLDELAVRLQGRRVLCDFVPVVPLSASCQTECFPVVPDEDLRRAVRDIAYKAIGRGLGLFLPSLTKARHCAFDDVNSFLVDTDGMIYKCSAAAERCVGQLDGESPKGFSLNYLKWLKWTRLDPFADQECRECRVLPLCMGGCAFKGQTFGKDARCPIWKDRPEHYFLMHAATRNTLPML